jgi:two-component system, LuxR family, response regulator FixJ
VDIRNRPVAIVDDDPAVLESLKFLLEVAGHPVVVYASAAKFLEDRGARPTCLIVDQHMPAMTGLELVARLRGSPADLPAMLITGLPSPAIVARAAQLGIGKVLEKPPAEAELLGFVEMHRA